MREVTSLMYTRKRRGPKTDPCGTPEITGTLTISKSIDNIIVTDEGGARNYYERVIQSVTSMQTQLKLSVSEPQTSANIGVKTTYSQSVSKINTSVEEEVTTRMISLIS